MHHIKRVLVTGAAGTVGGYVVGHLLQHGYHVIATDMCPVQSLINSGRDYWHQCAKISCRDQLSLCQRDLSDPKEIKTLMEFAETCDAIIHCAALIDVALPYEALKAVNVDAPVNLYRELAENGGKIFVFLSSGSIYGNAPLLTEKTPVQPNSPYEQTKADAEKLLMAEYAANSGGPKLAILRPSLIYGPKNKFLAANYLAIAVISAELLGKRLPLFFSGPKTNFVHAEDVGRAAIFLMENEQYLWQPDDFFNICDDSPLGFGDQLTLIAKACGYGTLPFRVPIPSGKFLGRLRRVYESPIFLKVLNTVLQTIWKILAVDYKLERAFTPDISKAMTPFFGQDTIFSNKKIKQLGFKLLHPDFAEGIKDVVRWYKDHRWIP